MPKHRILSFRYAFEGILSAFKTEPNLKFHFTAGLLVVFLGWFFQISTQDWLIITIVTGFVISLELTNTAIEVLVDYLIPNIHPVAKKVKDISAGAVLISAMAAFVVGLIIFLPYLNTFLR